MSYSNQVPRQIAAAVRSSKYFTIIADEVTDREQVAICFRWVDENFEPHEDFVGLSAKWTQFELIL